VAGPSILNTALTRRSLPSINGCACDCAAFSVSVEDGTDRGEDGTISYSPMLSLLSMGCSPGLRPILGQVNPLVGKTTDWTAGCVRSACPVRREGEPGPLGSSYPYKARTAVFRSCVKTLARSAPTVDPRLRGGDAVGFTRPTPAPSFPRTRESRVSRGRSGFASTTTFGGPGSCIAVGKSYLSNKELDQF
jgi:hypothetical protein